MRLKRVIALAIICIMGFTIPTFAESKPEKVRDPIFMGKVLEVDKNDKDSNVKIRVKGYIKSCDVYEEELIVLINNETKIMTGDCNKEKADETNKKEVVLTDLVVKKGDTIFIKLNNAMTKSIPPQVNAKKIKVTSLKE